MVGNLTHVAVDHYSHIFPGSVLYVFKYFINNGCAAIHLHISEKLICGEQQIDLTAAQSSWYGSEKLPFATGQMPIVRRLHPDKMYDHFCCFGHGGYEIPAICEFCQFPVRNCLKGQLICNE